jgi:oxygen-independent coproporphyrinogen III oxidase
MDPRLRAAPDSVLAAGGPAGPGLYVHIPFCRSRCVYCDFATQAVARDDPRVDRYLAALRTEWESRGVDWAGFALREGGTPSSEAGQRGVAPSPGAPRLAFGTIYVGGGTPSWLGEERLVPLVLWLRGLASDPGLEFTVEANPDSLTRSLARGLIEAGVTRFSIGAQSLDDAVLRATGRPHDALEVASAVAAVREAGDRARPARADISLDLICGAPRESDASWHRTVEGALALEPQHVSVYALTLEEGTPLERAVRQGRVRVPDEDDVADRLTWAGDRLEAGGLARYEISNWALPGHECRHNLNYWRYGLYLGLGSGAVTREEEERISAPGDLDLYLAALGCGPPDLASGRAGTRHQAPASKDFAALRPEDLPGWEREHLDGCTKARERVMLGLRLVEGAPRKDIEVLGQVCRGLDAPGRAERWIADGLLERNADGLRLTPAGMLLGNEVLADLTVE